VTPEGGTEGVSVEETGGLAPTGVHIGSGFWATVTNNGFALCYGTVVLSVLSVTLVYCGQTVGWIKMPLGTEVGLGPGDIVLDEDPALPLRKGVRQPLTFRPIVATRSPISAAAELLSLLISEARI